MAAIVRTQLQQKAINKVTGVMQDYPLGIEFGELMQKTGYKKSALYNVLSMVGASKSDEGLWHLPHRNTSDAPVNEVTEDDLEDIATDIDQPVTQDDGGNMQDNGGNTQEAPVNIEDEELNTQAPKVSSPDNDGATLINTPATLINTPATLINTPATLINTSAEVVSPSDIDTDTDQQDTTEVGQVIVSIDDLHPEFAQLPDYQSSNSQAIETTSQGLAAELKQLDNAYLDGLASKAEAPNAEVSQAIHPEFFGGDKVYVLNAGSPYIHEIDWVENNQLGTVHFKDSMDSRSQKWLLPATKENHAKLCALMPWIEWQRPELVGSDLMLKILEDDEVWLCRVGNDGDENCSFEDIRLVVGQHDEKGFFVAGRGDIAFKNAVPVNVHGAPLTESDVFGAA